MAGTKQPRKVADGWRCEWFYCSISDQQFLVQANHIVAGCLLLVDVQEQQHVQPQHLLTGSSSCFKCRCGASSCTSPPSIPQHHAQHTPNTPHRQSQEAGHQQQPTLHPKSNPTRGCCRLHARFCTKRGCAHFGRAMGPTLFAFFRIQLPNWRQMININDCSVMRYAVLGCGHHNTNCTHLVCDHQLLVHNLPTTTPTARTAHSASTPTCGWMCWYDCNCAYPSIRHTAIATGIAQQWVPW